MDFMTGVKRTESFALDELMKDVYVGQQVRVNGAIHTIRHMGYVAFVVLRKRDGLLQCVYETGVAEFDLKDLKEEATVEVTGILNREERAPGGKELRLRSVRILSLPAAPMPLPVAKWKLNTSLETKMNMRSISLRNVRERAKFKLQEGLVRGFREFLYAQGFTEIHTPKIGARSAEGG